MPENGWDASEPPADLEPQGYNKGQVVPDLRLTDQHGDEVSLWQFYGDIILFDVSTMWCSPCQELAWGVDETSAHFEEDGFTYLTVLQEAADGGEPGRADLNSWGDTFSITTPILGDPEKLSEDALKNGQYPALLIIGRDMKVVSRVNPATDEAIREAVEALL
jgi:hypothetical protein